MTYAQTKRIIRTAEMKIIQNLGGVFTHFTDGKKRRQIEETCEIQDIV